MRAAEEDHTWSLSGTLKAGETDEVSIAVTNQTTITAATLEVHYDSTLLEFQSYGDTVSYAIGRAAGWTVIPSTFPGYVRLTMINLNEAGQGNIVPGSGNVAKVAFKVKAGVANGTKTTLQLTPRLSRATLATKQFEITGDIWSNPGDPVASTWSFTGTITADSLQTELYVNVSNTKWLGGLTLDVAFDSTLVQPVVPVDQNVRLLRRATDMNLAVAYTAGSGHLRLVLTSPSSVPPFQVIDVGSGPVASLKFDYLAPPAGGTTLTVTLRLGDGTQLATKSFSVRAYSGPSADVDGNGQTNIFDLLDFLTKWTKEPPTVFTDVNGDGKTDIFDLLAILKKL
jgi:hypothetical protein